MKTEAIDIESFPELVHLAEEVPDTNEPRVLRHGAEDLAKIIPLRPRRLGR